MASLDPDSLDDGDEPEDSDVAGLLRAVARAPRPDAMAVARRALPEALADTESLPPPPGVAPRPGDVVDGRYRIDDVLGRGGMGVVFGAMNLTTGRRVALKWMLERGEHRTESERDAAFARFLREAQAAGRIQHPHVVDVYDAGQDPSSPYLVMECLEGETLRTRMERGVMSWEEATALLVPAMRGVAEAHRKGVVHRDLKPDNVFLARVAGRDEICPKVLDFGVSRLRVQESAEPSLTRTGTLIGTPAYMPLEQLRGDGNIDERTDVYALGVVLYEMLTGRRPYVARNAADFAALIASEPATALGKLRPELKGAREATVMKALARDPAQRHASVDAFITALDAARTVERSPRTWWAVTLVLLALAGVAAWRALRTEEPAPELTSAPAPKLTSAPVVSAPAPSVAAPSPVPVIAGAAPSVAPTPSEPDPERERPSTAVRAVLAGPPSAATGTKRPKPASAPPQTPAPAASEPGETLLRPEHFRATSELAPAQPSSDSPGATEAPPSLDLGRDQF